MIVKKKYFCVYCNTHLRTYALECHNCGSGTANRQLRITEIDEASIEAIKGKQIDITFMEDEVEVEHFREASITMYIQNIGTEPLYIHKINFPYWDTKNRRSIPSDFTLAPQTSRAVEFIFDTHETDNLGASTVRFSVESDAYKNPKLEATTILFVHPLSQTNPVQIPINTKIIKHYAREGSGRTSYWVKKGGSVHSGGGACTYYLESGARLIKTGGANVLFVKNGAMLSKDVSANIVYCENIADIRHCSNFETLENSPSLVQLPRLTFKMAGGTIFQQVNTIFSRLSGTLYGSIFLWALACLIWIFFLTKFQKILSGRTENVVAYYDAPSDFLGAREAAFDLRKPLLIEFRYAGSSSVEIKPKKKCQIILPDGKTLNINSTFIYKVSLEPNNTRDSIAYINKISVSFSGDPSIEELGKELRQIENTLFGNTNTVDKWLATRSQADSRTPDMRYSSPEYMVNVSVVGEHYQHGKLSTRAHIHYISIELTADYFKKFKLPLKQ